MPIRDSNGNLVQRELFYKDIAPSKPIKKRPKLTKVQRRGWWQSLSDTEQSAYVSKKEHERENKKQIVNAIDITLCPICGDKNTFIYRWDDEHICVLCSNCYNTYYKDNFSPGLKGWNKFKKIIKRRIR